MGYILTSKVLCNEIIKYINNTLRTRAAELSLWSTRQSCLEYSFGLVFM